MSAAAIAAAAAYKREKEAWVHGLEGGPPVEVVAVTLVSTFAVYAYNYLQAHIAAHRLPTGSLWARTAVEMALIALPMLLACTRYAALAPFIPLATIAYADYYSTEPQIVSSMTNSSGSEVPAFTIYRASMMLYTVIAILAVDFDVFPRRFAKVETFGLSLMDLGVGGFVFSMGAAYGLRRVRQMAAATMKQSPSAAELTSPPPASNGQLQNRRRRPSLTVRTAARANMPQFPRGNILWKPLRSSLPLLVLGLGRMALVKGTDYQEHVSEYGTHWNFFFTLGLLSPLVALGETALQQFAAVNNSGSGHYSLAGILFAVVYQLALSTTGLQDWAMTAPRTTFLSANKEGICSLFGYGSIFFFGAAAGEWIDTYARVESADRRALVRDIVHLDLLLWSLYYAADTALGLQTSRRLANGMYILFVVASNLLVLTALFIIDDANRRPPLIFQAINYNSLAIFLLANVCTGLVNHSMYTLYAGDGVAFFVLSAYLTVVVLTAVRLHHLQIRLKL